MSLNELGLSQVQGGNDSSKRKKEPKLIIPKHEDMPQEDEKKAPVPYAELKFFQHPGSAHNSFHGGNVDRKTDGSRNKNLYNTFKDRLDEVQTLRVLCKSIKGFIKRNKATLLTKQEQSVPHIMTMQRSLHNCRSES